MNLRHSLTFLLVLGLGALVAACDRAGETAPVVATVNGEPITESELESYLKLRRTKQPSPEQAEAERKAALDEMVNHTILVQSAVRDQLDEDPEVAFQLKWQRENVLATAAWREYLEKHPITDEELEARYEAEMKQTHGNEYRVRHIQVKTEAEAKDLIAQLRRGADFAQLAAQKSMDVGSGRRGGDLGWINQGQMASAPEFFQAVTGLKKGRLSPAPVKSGFGWHVIRVEDVRAWEAPPFAKVKDGLHARLQQERMQAMIGELRKQAEVEIK
jgi:peptidyl-prolyl cis-trans isomerase C